MNTGPRLVRPEAAAAPVVEDLRAEDVRGEEVDRELDAGLNLQVDGVLRQRVSTRSVLASARHALEEDVAAA